MDNSSQLYNKMKKVVVVVWSRLPKVPEEEGKVEEDEEEGLMTYFGAGVVIDDRGYILTCAHLVPRGFEVTVRRSDEDAFQEAYVLHRSVKEDLAILRTGRVGQYEFCQFGDTSSLQMGMPVFALIHANKVEFSFVAGDVVCPERPKEHIPPAFFNFSYPDGSSFIQINNLHCSSCSHGAPVFDSTGKVLGLIAVTAGFDFAIRLPPLKKLVRWCKGHL
ncbi:uncharacterized protein LOC131301998 isoform X1 [Rhododendron vialii]|uniref:uncharacterized protein LOC131301998 isoform X1 n=1 Tax=Rhododendron vialii TaxID=182163 RepID=UPI00265FCD41|nr:uncharacterized protein LOC131301998 isoform X1 [Rhododendron vialii]XP_058184535.1 uncharacterized protein LOC131301998 isoform X1 [Rhododendron vialii]XP_058184539.1 uncharacterized protein LOC131301998 isoform X1 [Rhododendron vialii]